jgi:predicted O-methyltransferase YrrM
MPLPSALRSRTPAAIKDHPGVRAVALAAGIIPPRPMHTGAEAGLLAEYASGASRVVELGVYEGSSAVMFCAVLAPQAELHLVDPFVDEHGSAMRAGWHGTPFATRMAVRRASRGGPRIRWHIERSQDLGRGWTGGDVDMVFIDGDHSAEACGEDWRVWHPHVGVGGAVAFHDARDGRHVGSSGPGPTAVVDALRADMPEGWSIAAEVDSLVIFRRDG